MPTDSKIKPAMSNDGWLPALQDTYDPNAEGYLQKGGYRKAWKMARVEGSETVFREMKWYERIHYWKGLPLGLEAWGWKRGT